MLAEDLRPLVCTNCDYGKPLACPRCADVMLVLPTGELLPTAGYRLLKRPGVRGDVCPNCRARLVDVPRRPRGYGSPHPCPSCGRMLVRRKDS